MQIGMYSRTADGRISYHGLREWQTPNDYFVACFPPGAYQPGPIEAQTVEGWPHSEIRWHGLVGYAPHYEKPRARCVMLTDADWQLAKDWGAGNATEGIRAALNAK